MRTGKTTIGNRVLALLLSIVMVLSWIPANAVAAVMYSNGTLEALTTGATPAGDATNPKLVYDAVELEWVDVDLSQGRTKAGWYIGMRVHAPAEMTKETDFIDGEKQVAFQTQGRNGWSDSANFWENQNSDKGAAETARYIDLWYYLDEERVHAAKVKGELTFGFKADWNMDGTFDQVFSMEIDPDSVILKKDGSQVFPAANSAVVSILNSDGSINSDGTISGNGTDYVKVTPGSTVYEWVAAEGIRPSDGWWAGIRVDVPQNASVDAKFKVGSTEYQVKDETETDADDKEFVPVWKSLSKLANGQDLSATKIEFDWDGNGIYEQMVEFTVNPANVTLMKDGENIYPGPEMVTVTVNKTGNGTVKVDGVEVSGSSVEVEKDKAVAIEVIADNGSYIKTLTVDGTAKTVAKGESYNENVAFDAAASIDVTFMEEYKVEVSANAGGTVKLDGAEVATKTVDIGTKVALNVAATEGYQIKSVNIGGVAQTISDVESFSAEITVDADVAVSVVFVKVYKITVSYGENGSIKVDGNDVLTGGTVVVEEGTNTATLVATPAEGYRVSAVVINDVPQNFDEHAYVHTQVLEMNKDYVVTVTFAQSVYDVTITPPVNGTVTIDDVDGKVNHGDSAEMTVTADGANGYEIGSVTVNGVAVQVDENGKFTISDIKEAKTIAATFVLKKYDVTVAPTQNGTVTTDAVDGKVEHGSNVVVTIEPAEGYSIGTVKVNGVDINTLTEETDEKATFTIAAATEAQTIEVTFIATEAAPSTITDLFNDEDAVRVDGMLYIYKNDGKITFTTDKNGIQIYVEGERFPLGGMTTKTVTIEETKVITLIQLRYRAEGARQTRWHDVRGFENGAKLSLVVDTTDPTATIDPADANANGYYKESFDVSVEFADPDNSRNNIANDYSGVASAKWWIENAGNKTQEGNFNAVDGQGTITVDAALNNSDNVVVFVEVTDKAGNTKTYKSETLKINCTAPVLESVLVAEETKKDEAEAGYYTKRVIKLTITDRATTFNQTAATNGIKITAKNAAGATLTVSPSMISWNSTGNTHVATIEFTMDANYTWEVSYTNLADMEMVAPSTTTNVTDTYQFAIDTTAPTGKITYAENVWEELLDKLTFGIWSSNSMTVTAEKSDITSPTKTVLYYKSNTAAAMTEDELEAAFQAGKFVEQAYTITADQKFAVYARIVDYAGNVTYIGTNGMVFDNTESAITITPEAPNRNGFYNKDVEVQIAVSEILTEGADYSGIKTIDYKVVKNGDYDHPTQSGNLYTFNIQNPTYEQLVPTWNGEITVEKGKNNADDIKVVVTVVDNAGKVSVKESPLSINIDELKATISFTDAANKIVGDRGYFSAENRVTTITLTDRGTAFDAAAATAGISITAKDAAGNDVVNAYTISSWNSNGNVHTATIIFHEDANYTWSFSYTNKADNELDVSKNLSTGTSVTPYVFTVDDTDPVGSASINTDVWDELLTVLTFGLYNKEEFTVVGDAKDNTSPVKIQYYKTDKIEPMTADELDSVQFVEYAEAYTESHIQQKSLTINDDERFVVYLKITDYAGNYIYVNSDGAIVDQTKADIVLTVDEPNASGIYNEDVNIKINVTDAAPYSGIKTVDYWVVMDGNTAAPTQSENLFTFGIAKPTHSQLVNAWEDTITIKADKNNSCDVVVHVKVVDNAGNEYEVTRNLDIDVTQPTIDVSYDNDTARNDKYFDANREATIVITERTHHFDAEAATAGITITAVDAKGQVVTIDPATMITGWDTKEGATADAATHTAKISYTTDANYTFSISYTDKADNDNKPVNTGTSVAPYEFAVDKVDPFGTITGASEEGRTTTWKELISNLTFGFWSGFKITITETHDDLTSPIESVQYYKTSDTSAKTAAELDQVTTWTKFDGIAVVPNEQFTVYLKITDNAGNYTYISTDGLIVDNTAPREESIAPEITVEPVQPVNGLYNGDVKVSIVVTDPLTGDTFAGLKKVTYRVLNLGEETQNDVLYSFDIENPTREQLLQTWTGDITVQSALNNSNDVVIEVYAEDNAGNTSTDKVAIQIDTTAPQIDIKYNNNTPDSGSYYKANREATIKITERNLDTAKITITITKGGAAFTDYTISNWVPTTGTGNLDDSTHEATITFDQDGDYTFVIMCEDQASWTCGNVANETYDKAVVFAEGTQNATEFTIDKTAPVVTVSYNNNSAQNDKYFNATRTATITITEHNFPVNKEGVVDVERVDFDWTVNGEEKILDVKWDFSRIAEDVYIATIVYEDNGKYTFGVKVKDLAGNTSEAADYGDTVAGTEFVIDTEKEMISLEGVENGAAYGYGAEVIPNIKISDINLQEYKVTLVGVQKDKTIDLTEEVNALLSKGTETVTGNFDIFETKQDLDGIYTLTMTSKDKAGNEDNMEIIFTVNRFGSVYVYEQYLVDLIANGGSYVYSVDEDLIITEYNADKLVTDSLKIEITVDGRPLEDVKFDVTPEINDTVSVGSSGWYQYKYTISKDNFKTDGVYKISVSSKDATGNTPENSNYENMSMSFRVDSTQAEITSIVGLEEAIINAQNVTVKYTVFDTIGLKSIKVYVNGQLVDEITDFSADMNNFNGQFVINEQSSAQSVRIVVEDMSGNITDTSAEDFSSAYAFNNSVTVSTNIFVRWYANKGLFWGSIAGIVVLAGGVIFFITAKRKKKEEEEAAK